MNLNAFYDTLRDCAEQGRSLLASLLVLSVLLGLYGASRIGLYLLARGRRLPGAWWAWLPVGDQILLGCLANQYRHRLTGQTEYRAAPVVITELAFIAANYLAMGWVGIFSIILAMVGLKAIGVALVNLTVLMFGGLEGAGKLLDAEEAVTSVMKSPEVGMVFLVGAALLLLLFVVTAVRTVFNSRHLLEVYRSCQYRSAKVLVLLGILFPFLKPVFLIFCAKKQMKGENVI